MVLKDKNNILKVLKLLWKFWEEDSSITMPSYEHDIQTSEFLDILYEKGRLIGLTEMDDEDKFFWWNAIIFNEDSLSNGTLTVNNLKLPKKKDYNLTWVGEFRTTVRKTYVHEFSSYLTEEQIQRNYVYLDTEDIIDKWDSTAVEEEFIDEEIVDDWFEDIEET